MLLMGGLLGGTHTLAKGHDAGVLFEGGECWPKAMTLPSLLLCS